ncbi:MAG: DUF72 domain-containing protein [Anaerolineae bacterium]|nr:DUF72 domain-containing protein [Thermoflexales bacterium]MDW8395861.1 DUF72 domain-containing protein [Anaerolineae bacterium]
MNALGQSCLRSNPSLNPSMALFVGCPMWGVRAWVGSFFPPGTRPAEFLSAYSRRMNTVEGNTTFYALPDLETVRRWRDQTPDGFRFCLKVPQAISHHKRLVACDAETEAFVRCLQTLGDRCGPAFLQLPPTFSPERLRDLDRWLARWHSAFRLAVEPRHPDLFGRYETELDALLRQYNVARCVFDTAPLFSAPPDRPATATAQARKPRVPTRRTRTADFVFVRYVGHPDLDTNTRWLMPWVEAVRAWLAEGRDVYFFCHHPDDALTPRLAEQFRTLVGKAIPPAAPNQLPLWESA